LPACRKPTPRPGRRVGLGLVAVLAVLPSIAQAADRASIYQSIDRRCQGLMQASRDDLANLASLGIAMPAMCQCIASTMTEKLLPSEGEAIVGAEQQLPPRVEALWTAARGFCAVSLKPR
jgi:hypothetical protein